MFEELSKLKSELVSAPQMSCINELLCTEKANRTDLEEASLYALESSLKLRENECCKEWFERKIEQLKCETCGQNCSSLLGEMRALGTCYHVWKKKFKPSESDEGGDFLADDGLSWIIEVNTPGESGDARSVPSVTKSGRITTEEQEICPFGSPPSGKNFREGKHDNVQGEAVSKFAQIKQDEHQFEKDKLNVLYVDLLDSKTQGMNVVSTQKLFDEIEKSKSVHFNRFLYALGIDGVGQAVADNIAKLYDNISQLQNAKKEDLITIQLVGDEIVNNIFSFFKTKENNVLIESLKKYINCL